MITSNVRSALGIIVSLLAAIAAIAALDNRDDFVAEARALDRAADIATNDEAAANNLIVEMVQAPDILTLDQPVMVENGEWYDILCLDSCSTLNWEHVGDGHYKFYVVPSHDGSHPFDQPTAAPLPTETPAPPTATPAALPGGIISNTLEFEDLVYSGSLVRIDSELASGGAYIDFAGQSGEIEIPINFAGCYSIDLRYAHNEPDRRNMSLKWDNERMQVFMGLPTTFGWEIFNTERFYFLVRSVIALETGAAGERVVLLKPHNLTGPNLDNAILTHYSEERWPEECEALDVGQQVPTETPEPTPAVGMGGDSWTYEAENLQYENGMEITETGSDSQTSGTVISFQNFSDSLMIVPVEGGPGCYTLRYHYAKGVSDTQMSVRIGDQFYDLSLRSTGSWGRYAFMTFDFEATERDDSLAIESIPDYDGARFDLFDVFRRPCEAPRPTATPLGGYP